MLRPTTAQGTVVSGVNSGTPGYGEYAFQLQDGIPASIRPIWPIFTPNAGALPGTVGAGAAVLGPSAGRPSRQYQWTVSLQRELNRNHVVEASYVGNRVVWLSTAGLSTPTTALATLNRISQSLLGRYGLQVGNAEDSTLLRTTFANLTTAQRSVMASRGLGLPYAGFPVAQTVQQSILSFPQYTSLTQAAALGNSWYDALQVVLTQRFWRGLSLSSNYILQDAGPDQFAGPIQPAAREESFQPGSAARVPALSQLHGS